MKREKTGSDWALRISITVLVFVAVGAVLWIVFFAEDRAKDFFSSDNLPDIPLEKTLPQEAGPQPPQSADRTIAILPSFDIVRISRNGTGVIAGRAEPNSDIYVYARDKIIGSAVADRNGEWVLLYDDPLPSGPTELSLKSIMPGALEVFSSNVVIVAVPGRNDDRFIEDETNGVIVILSPRTGGGPTRVLQKPRLVNFAELAKGLSLDSLDYGGNSNTVISGTALRNTRVRLYLDNDYLAEVTASDEGIWSHSFVKELDFEEHVIRIDQLLDDDNVEVRIEQPFTRDTDIDITKAKGEVIVRPGNSLWHIARRLYGSGFHYTMIFGANKNLIMDPDLIYPGQKFALPTGPVTEP
ncbi:MAG: hypothetical protein COB49_12995 [Alphaproteobacteria bacterium]|nr:MAG: hypothetical protein COB49_12995 [Alphaproteobacteria bacterium]